MIKEDYMTPLQRAKAIANGEKFDRLPVKPHMGVTLASAVGSTAKEYVFLVDKMVQVEVDLYRRLHQDSAGISITLRGMAEAMGSEMYYPENDISQLVKPAVETVEDIKKLKIVDVTKDGKLPVVIEGLVKLREKIGNEVGIGAGMAGPFSVAASVIGTEKLLRWMIKKPEAVHEVMRIITRNNEEYIKAIGKLGFVAGFSDPVSSASLLKLDQFREFSLPYLAQNLEHVEKYCGKRGQVHICGKSRPLWEDLLTTKMGSFSIDNIEDLAEAKDVLGKHVSLLGNVPPVEVMFMGTDEDVRKASKDCIDKCFDSEKGYNLGTGCQIPIGTSLERLEVFMKAGREFGSYERIQELKEMKKAKSLINA